MPRDMCAKRHLILIGIIGFLISCTNISIYSNGIVETEQYWGIPIVNINPDNQSTIVKTKSFGIVKSPSTFNIGYLKETYYVPNNKCEIVLFEPDKNNIESLKALINTDKSICTTDEKNYHENN